MEKIGHSSAVYEVLEATAIGVLVLVYVVTVIAVIAAFSMWMAP